MSWNGLYFKPVLSRKKVHVDKIQKYFESWFMHKWSMSAWEETWEEKMLCMCKCIVHKTCSMDHMSVHRMRQIAVWVFVYKSWMFPFFTDFIFSFPSTFPTSTHCAVSIVIHWLLFRLPADLRETVFTVATTRQFLPLNSCYQFWFIF